jgi:hypothetical protein
MLGLCRPIASGVDTNSTPACSGNNICASGSCLLGPGQPCTMASQCAAGTCSIFFRDADGDGFGAGTMSVRICGNTPPTGYVTSSSDCCDTDNRVRPSQTTHFPATNMCGSFDYNCDGFQTVGDTTIQKCDTVSCSSGWCPRRPDGTPGCGTIVPSCGVAASWLFCHRTGPGGGFCDQITEQRTQGCL